MRNLLANGVLFADLLLHVRTHKKANKFPTGVKQEYYDALLIQHVINQKVHTPENKST